MSKSISFCKQEAQLLPRDHAKRNVSRNLNPSHSPNPHDRDFVNAPKQVGTRSNSSLDRKKRKKRVFI